MHGSVMFQWIFEKWGCGDVDWLNLNWIATGGKLARMAVSLVLSTVGIY
jgi:hypothetical protein